MNGNFSVIETAYERFFPLVAAGGAYAIFDDIGLFRAKRGKILLRKFESAPKAKVSDRTIIKLK
ncbi:MAG TPA: hypothetical protein PLK80_04040 [bacterium]|nr:hypothetical protein [bacterium]